jgi:type II secretory pathway pseudopilin PulG/microcystin-dependent protein
MEAKRHRTTKILTTNWNSSNLGFTLLEAMVTVGIMSVAAMGVMGVNVTAMKANKSASLRSDIIDVKRTITNKISCEKTIPTKPAPCAPGTAISLKDAKGEFLAPSGKIGEWTIEASCEFLGTPAAPGLSIYATKKTPGSDAYAKDPLRNINFDRSHPSSSLFKPDVRLCAERFSNTPPEGGPVPVGGIIMWSGSPGSVPAGWALCNGSNGTPNLLDRFVIGAGSSYSANTAGGGERSVTIGIDQMPHHAHGFSDNGQGYLINANRDNEEIMVTGWDKDDLTGRGYGWHSTRLTYGTGGAVWGAGGGQPLAIPLPPWYALAYIMRLE